MAREDVIDALAEKIKTITFAEPINNRSTFVSVERKLKLWSDVPSDRKPAAFLVEHSEQAKNTGVGTGVIRRMTALLYAYTNTTTEIGGTHLNIILDALEEALKPDVYPKNLLRLGQAGVYYVRIEGQIFKDPGDIDGESVLIVPIVIEIP